MGLVEAWRGEETSRGAERGDLIRPRVAGGRAIGRQDMCRGAADYLRRMIRRTPS